MTLLSVLNEEKLKERRIRILILGLDNAGKSTVVEKLLNGDTSLVSPTVGYRIRTAKFNQFTLEIWDIGGQKSLRTFWMNYFARADGLVWVIDSADSSRIDLCGLELRRLLTEERLVGAPLLILANKHDLRGAMCVSELETRLGVNEFMDDRKCAILSCSAQRDTRSQLTRGFDWLIACLRPRFVFYEAVQEAKVVVTTAGVVCAEKEDTRQEEGGNALADPSADAVTESLVLEEEKSSLAPASVGNQIWNMNDRYSVGEDLMSIRFDIEAQSSTTR